MAKIDFFLSAHTQTKLCIIIIFSALFLRPQMLNHATGRILSTLPNLRTRARLVPKHAQ